MLLRAIFVATNIFAHPQGAPETTLGVVYSDETWNPKQGLTSNRPQGAPETH